VLVVVEGTARGPTPSDVDAVTLQDGPTVHEPLERALDAGAAGDRTEPDPLSLRRRRTDLHQAAASVASGEVSIDERGI
jgi:hypothetical protein